MAPHTGGPLADLRQEERHRDSPTRIPGFGRMMLVILVAFFAVFALVASIGPR